MGVYSGPDLKEDGLVLCLDGANYKSFKGEDTYNYTRNSRDFSGSSYGSSDEWPSNPSVLSKTYISSIATPVGNGATLIQESGSNGYHHLSRWGGGGESGAHSLSCYVFPLTSDITNFVIGMLGDGGNQISFNLNTREITYGSGISNRDAFITPVVGFDGWYRVGANIEGRYGGWVGCIGYTTSAIYTGTSGNKKCYITGIQYELKTKPTMFTEAQTTRGTTVATGGGWADLSGRANHGELVNGVRESSDNLGALVFDGTNDYISIPFETILNDCSIEIWFKATSTRSYQYLLSIGNEVNSSYSFYLDMNDPDGGFAQTMWVYWNSSGSPYSVVPKTGTYGDWNDSTWRHYVFTRSSTTNHYMNGSLVTNVSRSGDQTTQFGNGSGYKLKIGVYQITNTNAFPGNIASVKIYNRALTASEIQQNFNATRSRFGI